MNSVTVRGNLDAWSASLKSALPTGLRSAIQSARRWLYGQKEGDVGRLIEDPPWCSPNVWAEIDSHCRKYPSASIFEYGCGASTLHHVRRLIVTGGSYIGVEADSGWFASVLAAMIAELVGAGHEVQITADDVKRPDTVRSYDTQLTIRSKGGAHISVLLRLRSAMQAGAPELAVAYAGALEAKSDLIVVDGLERKLCVNRALDGGFLRPGGLLVLCEAGRGYSNWLGRPTLQGDLDYRPEVTRMLRAGARLINGIGVDRWPGLKRRRALGREARGYPMEACALYVPVGGGADDRPCA